jgi:ankyrin repeat protein
MNSKNKKHKNDNNFYELCKKGDLNKIKKYVEFNKSIVNTPNMKSHPYPIHYACISGNVEVVKYLLDNGASIEQKYYHTDDKKYLFDKPIYIASNYGHIDLVNFLFDNGADVYCKNLPLLHYLCKIKKTHIIKLLIDKKINIDNVDNQNKTCLHVVCQENNDEYVELLVKNVCNVNLRDNDGLQPIQYACRNNNFNIVKILIDNGADYYNYINKALSLNNDYSYSYDEYYDKHSLLELKKNDELKRLYFNGYTNNFKIQSLWNTNSIKIIKYLIKSDKTYKTHGLYYLGIIQEYLLLLLNKKKSLFSDPVKIDTIIEILKLLISNHIENGFILDDDVLLQNIHKSTIFENIFRINDSENYEDFNIKAMFIIYLIKKSFIDVNMFIDRNKNTFMHYFSTMNDVKYLEIIFEYGAKVNVFNSDDMLPIHYACIYSKHDNVIFLIKNKSLLNELFLINKYYDYYKSCLLIEYLNKYYEENKKNIVMNIFHNIEKISTIIKLLLEYNVDLHSIFSDKLESIIIKLMKNEQCKKIIDLLAYHKLY